MLFLYLHNYDCQRLGTELSVEYEYKSKNKFTIGRSKLFSIKSNRIYSKAFRKALMQIFEKCSFTVYYDIEDVSKHRYTWNPYHTGKETMLSKFLCYTICHLKKIL